MSNWLVFLDKSARIVLETVMMMIAISFVVGCVSTSFLEYWIHRFQHQGMVKGSAHAGHHEFNQARGILRECWSYLSGGFVIYAPITIVTYVFLTPQIAIGWLSGTFCSMAFSAWSHEVQHTDPNLVFWSLPMHYIHHNRTPNKNFGFNFPLWDKLFGTYQEVEWKYTPAPGRNLFKVRWL